MPFISNYTIRRTRVQLALTKKEMGFHLGISEFDISNLEAQGPNILSDYKTECKKLFCNQMISFPIIESFESCADSYSDNLMIFEKGNKRQLAEISKEYDKAFYSGLRVGYYGYQNLNLLMEHGPVNWVLQKIKNEINEVEYTSVTKLYLEKTQRYQYSITTVSHESIPPEKGAVFLNLQASDDKRLIVETGSDLPEQANDDEVLMGFFFFGENMPSPSEQFKRYYDEENKAEHEYYSHLSKQCFTFVLAKFMGRIYHRIIALSKLNEISEAQLIKTSELLIEINKKHHQLYDVVLDAHK